MDASARARRRCGTSPAVRRNRSLQPLRIGLPTPLVRATAASSKERGSFSQVKCSDRGSFYQRRLARRRQTCRPFNRRRSRLQAGAPVACSQCTQTQETRRGLDTRTRTSANQQKENKTCRGPSAKWATGTTARRRTRRTRRAICAHGIAPVRSPSRARPRPC